MSAPPLTRYHQLQNAIDRADLTPSDFRVYVALLWRADFRTTDIPEKFQFRSVVKLAEWCHISHAGVKRSIAHLERHGWIKRDPGNGRGHRTRYTLHVGLDCDCKQAHREPLSEEKQAQDEPIKGLTTDPVNAGQPRFCAEEAVKGEVVRWGSPGLGMYVKWEDSS